MKEKRRRESGAKQSKPKKAKVAAEGPSKGRKKNLEEMSVDDFLDGGFLTADIPDSAPTKNTASSKKGKPAKKGKEQDSGRGGVEKKQPASTSKSVANKKPEKQKDVASTVAKGAGKAKKQPAREPGAPAEKSKKNASSEHKSQLEALKEKDPEFYKYLLDTDKGLLEFGHSDAESDEEEEDEDAAEESEDEASDEEDLPADDAEDSDEEEEPSGVPESGRKQPGDGKDGILTQAMVEKWCTEAKDHGSMGAFERLVKAYRVACHLGDNEEDMDATMRIVSSAVFNKVMVFMIKEADPILRKHMKLPAGNITPDQVKKAPRWKKLENAAKSYLGNSLHLLGEVKDESMLVFMLRHLRQSAAFLIVSDRLRRKYLKLLLQHFGEGESGTRVQAILFIRQMALLLPPPTMSLAMKGVYRAFVVNAKFMSVSSAAHIDFMATCVIEIFGLDSAAAYEHGFTYIKQLAVLLRGALSMKTKDAFREVYCWQTVNTLELWTRLLATHADKEDLRGLVYPLVQIVTGAIRLVPTPRYFPLRLRLLRSLNRLSSATGLFVPVAPLLLEMLQWRGLHTAVKSGGGPQMQTTPQLRAGKQLLATATFQQSLVDEVLLLLAEHFAQWATSPAFPEMAHLVLLQLHKMSKDAKVEKFRTVAAGLVAAIQANSTYVLRARSSLECSPKETAALASFLSSDAEHQQAPMRKYAKSLADKAARQRRLVGAEEVEIGGRPPVDDESDDGGDPPDLELLLQLQKKKAARAKQGGQQTEAPEAEEADEEASDDESSEEEEDMNQDDFVRNFELSESDDDEAEEA